MKNSKDDFWLPSEVGPTETNVKVGHIELSTCWICYKHNSFKTERSSSAFQLSMGPLSGVEWLQTEGENLPRLVSFNYCDLIAVHQAVMKRLKGVSSFQVSNKSKANPDQAGFFIAHAFRNFAPAFGQDVSQWTELYGPVNGASGDRIEQVRRSCLEEMANTASSSLNFEELFGEGSYQEQRSVSVPMKELVTKEFRVLTRILPEVQKAYGSSKIEGGFPWTA